VKSDEALAAEQNLEAKFSDIGFGKDRIDVRAEAAPEPVEEGTPAAAETVQADPLRDERGRFTSTEEPTAEESTPSAEDPTGTGQDPAVAAFLAKYGGDVSKALAGAVHLQRKSGEQSNEVGELRRMVDELSQLREGIQAQNQQQQQPVMDQATVDWFDEQAAMNPYGAAEYARQQGNELLLQRALANWKEIDPYQASVYTNSLQNQQMYAQFEERLSKAQQLPVDTTVHMALTNVRSRNPEFSNYDDAIEATMQKYPALQDALQSAASAGDTAKLEAAIETAYALAQGDTLKSLALSGPAPEQSTTTTSGIVAPTVSEAHGDEPVTLTRSEQMKADMNQEIANRRRGVFVAE